MHVCNPQGQSLIFFPVTTSIAACIKQFNETKESVYIRKELNSQRTGFVHQHGRCFIVLEHQYGCHDIMCMRSIQPLLLTKKCYGELICYNVKYTAIFHIFHHAAPHMTQLHAILKLLKLITLLSQGAC